MAQPPEQEGPDMRDHRLSIWPEWIRGYNWRTAYGDLYAGLIVGIMIIPQGMAYAFLAGMPPIYGLYASLVPLIVYALSGSSRHLAVGTVAIDSLIMLFALSAYAEPRSNEYIGFAFMFAIMVGTVHLLLSIGRMGFLVNLLSKPVIAGFISAAATIIGFSQLGDLTGLELPRTQYVYDILYEAFLEAEQVHLISFGIGVGSIIILVSFRKWNRRFPAALILVAAGILCTWLLDLEQNGVAVVGTIPTGLPGLRMPAFDASVARELVVAAIMLALIQFTNVVSLAKSYAVKYDYAINPNRELFALGLTNVVGGFFQSYTVSGSFSRTAINADSGAKTPMSNIFTAMLVAIALLLLTPLLYYIPIPILAAIIMVAAFGMIKIEEVRKLYRIKRIEGYLAIMTFIVTLLFGLQAGILTGIVASVTLVMYRIGWPHVAILGNLPETRSYRDVTVYDEAKEISGILILRVDASFLYTNADFLKDLILKKINLEGNSIHSVIIDASSVNDMDTTAVDALFTIANRLKSRGIDLYFTGIHGKVRGVIERSGLKKYLGDDRYFLSPHRAVQHIRHLKLDHGASHASTSAEVHTP